MKKLFFYILVIYLLTPWMAWSIDIFQGKVENAKKFFRDNALKCETSKKASNAVTQRTTANETNQNKNKKISLANVRAHQIPLYDYDYDSLPNKHKVRTHNPDKTTEFATLIEGSAIADDIVDKVLFADSAKPLYLYCRAGAKPAQTSPPYSQGDPCPLHRLIGFNPAFTNRLSRLERIAILCWAGGSISSKDSNGRQPTYRCDEQFRTEIDAMWFATVMVKVRYEKEQIRTPILLEEHIISDIAPLVMDYVQPVWVHDLWPAIRRKSGIKPT